MSRTSKSDMEKRIAVVAQLFSEGKGLCQILVETELTEDALSKAFIKAQQRGLVSSEEVARRLDFHLDSTDFVQTIARKLGVGKHSIVAIDSDGDRVMVFKRLDIPDAKPAASSTPPPSQVEDEELEAEAVTDAPDTDEVSTEVMTESLDEAGDASPEAYYDA